MQLPLGMSMVPLLGNLYFEPEVEWAVTWIGKAVDLKAKKIHQKP